MTSRPDDHDPIHALLPLDTSAGPARRLSSERARVLVETALDAWKEDPGIAGPRTSGLHRSPRKRWLPVSAGALLVVAGAAAAHHASRPSPEEPLSRLPSVVRSHESSPAVRAPGADDRAPSMEPVVADEPEVTLPSRSPVDGVKTRVPSALEAPEDGLRAANRLRAEGRFREAEQAYVAVTRKHPGSGSAYVARVAAANLRLEHLGDPGGARALFQAALAAGGALDLEVRSGIARASRRLGDRAGEIAALRALAAAHPSSPSAAEARQRLSELQR